MTLDLAPLRHVDIDACGSTCLLWTSSFVAGGFQVGSGLARQWIRYSPVSVGSGFISNIFYVMASSGPVVGSRPALHGVLRRLEKCAQSLLLIFVSCLRRSHLEI